MASPRVRSLAAALVGLVFLAGACSDRSDTAVATSGEVPLEFAAAVDTTTTDPPRSTTTSTTAAPTTTAPAPTTTAPPATTTTPPTTPPPTTAPPVTTTAPPAISAGASNHCEAMMTARINQSRSAAGVATLAEDGAIRWIARDWSAHMSETDTLAHNPNMSSQVDSVRPWVHVGENVGTFTDLERLYQAFMDSASHRSNILASRYTYVSVGCVQRSDGVYWVTQLFWA